MIGVASPYRGRSHFDAQDMLENGTAETSQPVNDNASSNAAPETKAEAPGEEAPAEGESPEEEGEEKKDDADA